MREKNPNLKRQNGERLADEQWNLTQQFDAELTADGRWQSRLSQLLVTQVAGDDLWCAAALTAAED